MTSKLQKTAKTAAASKNKIASKIGERIESLDERLAKIARKFAQFEKGAEWMDYYQTMLKALLERDAVDPTFFDQNDAFILKYAEFVGRHTAKKASVYLRYVDEEGNDVDPEKAEDGGDSRLDLMVTRSKLMQAIENVESEVMNSELVAVIGEGAKLLSKENATIVYMIYLGYKQVEIAEAMGISKPAVSQRMKTIASTLQGFVQGY